MEKFNAYKDVGKINIDLLKKEFGVLKTDKVVLMNEREKHIKTRHLDDYNKYINLIPIILENPDEIIKDSKNFGTVFYIKRLGCDNLNVILRLVIEDDNKKYKNSIMTFYRLRDKNLRRLEERNKIIYKK